MDSRMSSPSFRIVLPHSSVCSDTGTEYGMGGRIWLLGLSGSSEHEVTTAVAGSSLTGMGVAKGAGMHWALDRSAESREWDRWGPSRNVAESRGCVGFCTLSDVTQGLQPVGGHLVEENNHTSSANAFVNHFIFEKQKHQLLPFVATTPRLLLWSRTPSESWRTLYGPSSPVCWPGLEQGPQPAYPERWARKTEHQTTQIYKTNTYTSLQQNVFHKTSMPTKTAFRRHHDKCIRHKSKPHRLVGWSWHDGGVSRLLHTNRHILASSHTCGAVRRHLVPHS